jgi:hypothetical protein
LAIALELLALLKGTTYPSRLFDRLGEDGPRLCRVARIDRALAEAKRRGVLSTFNAAYRDARKAARAQGRHFACYALAFERLKRELYRRATSGERITDRTLIEQGLGR